MVISQPSRLAEAVLAQLVGDDEVDRVSVLGMPAPPGTCQIGAGDGLDRACSGAASVILLSAPADAGHHLPVALDGTGNLADARFVSRLLGILARSVTENQSVPGQSPSGVEITQEPEVEVGRPDADDADDEASGAKQPRGSRASSEASAKHLVVVTSAMVYGAWANNPVPLTEDAPLRPNPRVEYAVNQAEIERLVAQWREANPRCTAAVLRPTVTVDPGSDRANRWLNRSPWSPKAWRSTDEAAPSQFLSVGDLAAAVDRARLRRLQGCFNVAPDGWIPPEQLVELRGSRPGLVLGSPASQALSRRVLRRSGFPEDVIDYTRHPWIVASDRLRAAGWAPADSNEEAFVGAYQGGPFASIDARRRQVLSFLVVGVAVLSAVGSALWLLRRRRRESPRASPSPGTGRTCAFQPAGLRSERVAYVGWRSPFRR